MKHGFIAVLTGLVSLSTASAFAAEPKTYALIVANNGSMDEDTPPLRYADDDGARYYEFFASITNGATLLTTLDRDSQALFPGPAKASKAPTRDNLKIAVANLQQQIQNDRGQGLPVEVFLVFTGHGNVDANGEGYLSLSDGALRRQDLLQDIIAPLRADFTHVIIDACHAYFMVNARGGNWKDDRSENNFEQEFREYLVGTDRDAASIPTVGVLLSTSGAQEVHEWSTYRGGVFSHQLRSALVGAADADGDGQITYPEVEAYLVAANAAVQNPNARIHVHVEGPAQDSNRTLTNLNKLANGTTLEVQGGLGPMWLEDARGLRYADLNLAPDGAARIKLLPQGQPYWVRTAKFEAAIPQQLDVSFATLTRVERIENTRGAVDEAFRTELFKTPFGPGFVAGFLASQREMKASHTSPTLNSDRPQWVWELDLDYRLAAPILSVGAVQHAFSVAASLRNEGGFSMGAFSEYGTASDLDTLHRAAIGVQLGWSMNISRIRAGVVARLGPQFVAVSVALHADTALTASLPMDDWAGFVSMGFAYDVITRADIEQNQEELWTSPYIGLGARF